MMEQLDVISWVAGTPPKINMEHNNGGLEDDFPFQRFHVNLPGGKIQCMILYLFLMSA